MSSNEGEVEQTYCACCDRVECSSLLSIVANGSTVLEACPQMYPPLHLSHVQRYSSTCTFGACVHGVHGQKSTDMEPAHCVATLHYHVTQTQTISAELRDRCGDLCSLQECALSYAWGMGAQCA
jgi:hypothetical protein